MIPFILVITLQGQKTLFFMFLMFQDLNGVKKGLIFREYHFLSTRTNMGMKKQQFWARRTLRAWPTRPSPPGRVEHPLGRLGRLIALILSPTLSS